MSSDQLGICFPNLFFLRVVLTILVLCISVCVCVCVCVCVYIHISVYLYIYVSISIRLSIYTSSPQTNPANGDQKKAGVAILISDKIDFEI